MAPEAQGVASMFTWRDLVSITERLCRHPAVGASGWPLALVLAAVLLWPGKGGLPRQVSAAPVTVERDTQVVYRTYYKVCDQTDEQVAEPLEPMVGASLERMRQIYPQWQVREFTRERVVLHAESDDFCPELKEWRHLKLEGGQLVVYYGKTTSALQVKKNVIALNPAHLRPDDRQRLEKGVDLEGDLQVELYLEGVGIDD